MKQAIVAGAAAAALSGVSAQQPSPLPQTPCRWQLTDPQMNVLSSWDLSGGYNATKDYAWQDRNDLYVKNNTYIFNVCSNTVVQPSGCTGSSPAWQLDQGSGLCFALSSDVSQRPAPISYGLVDYRNIARGVAMTYTGGNSQFCPNGGRTFTINFWCAPFPFPAPAPPPTPGANNSFNGQYWIDEFSTCNYLANSYSNLGCPLECPAPGGKLCSYNGVCGFDNNIMKSRCFCNDDFIESDCSAPRYPTPTGAIAGSVIGGLLVGAVAVVGAIFFVQKRNAASGVGAVDGFYGMVQ